VNPWRRKTLGVFIALFFLVVCAWVVIASSTARVGDPVTISTIVAADVAVLTAATGGVAAVWRWTRPAPPPTPSDLADELANLIDDELRDEAQRRNLRDPSGLIPITWAGGAVHCHDFDGATSELAAAFNGLSTPRLLVLGEPGSGKTSIVVLLSIGLLADRAPSGPLPVIIPISEWDPVRIPKLDTFIVQSLARRHYGGAPGVPETLLSRGLLIPVLDGLDEIAEPERLLAVESIERAIGNTSRKLVVTCRKEEYDGIIKRSGISLRRVLRVRVNHLGTLRAIDYLKQQPWPTTVRWDSVYDVMRNDPTAPITIALSTPLMISLAKSVYRSEGQDPNDLLDRTRFRSPQAIEDHLAEQAVFGAYQPSSGVGPASTSGPDATEASRWLAALARSLHRSSTRDIAWWRLYDQILPRWSVLGIAVIFGLALLVGGFTTMQFALPTQIPGFSSLLLIIMVVLGCIFAVGAITVWFVVAAPAPTQVVFRGAGSWTRLRKGLATGVTVGAILSVATLAYRVVFISTGDVGWSIDQFLVFCQWAAGAILFTLVLGLALAAPSWICAAPERPLRVGPDITRKKDRAAALLGSGLAALIVAILIIPTMTASVIIGTLIGDLFTDWPGRSGDSDIGAVLYGALFSARSYVGSAATAGAVAAIPSVIVGGLTLLSFAWPRFALANTARFFGNLPRNLPAFLADATERGILRQSGSTYQFRHVRLQETLVRSAHATDLLSSVRARRRRIVNRVGMATGVLIVLTVGLLVPHVLRKDTGLALPADNVIEVRWSRDGRTLLTASDWGTSSAFTIRGWSSQSGREVGRPILASAWATDSVTGAFATVSPSATKDVGHVTIWSKDGQLLFDVGQASDLEFSPRGGTFATYDNSRKEVQLWDERTGVMSGRKFTDVLAATYSPNGEALVTIDNGLNAHLWDPQSGQVVSSLSRDLGHSSADNVRERSLAVPYLPARPKITPFDEIQSQPPFNSPRYSLEGTMRELS
jgi:hypothetical protein